MQRGRHYDPSMGDARLVALARFNELGGKLRVALTERCNLDCFFCHNEGMPNPRRGAALDAGRLSDEQLVAIMNAWTALGGAQLNLTGGEPLLHPRLWTILEAIERRKTRVILNTNGLLAHRLLDRSTLAPLDALFVSLHTVDESLWKRHLVHGSAASVLEAIARLRQRGYRVQLNFSLGDYNLRGFDEVLRFALDQGIDLKIIALIRAGTDRDFYGGAFADPLAVEDRLAAHGAARLGERRGLGGFVTRFSLAGSTIEVKNVARGRLRTSFCEGCPVEQQCGEGMYALRVGVDGWWKPCLLRRERFTRVDESSSLREQLLDRIATMIGAPESARFADGPPL